MQDNLARKIEEPVVPDLKVYENPHKKRIDEIEKIIDSLLDIRLTLSVKKIISPTINKNELRKIVNDAKQKNEDEIIKQEIDKIFDEYLPNDKIIPFKNTSKEIWDNNSVVFKPGVEAKIDGTIKKLNDEKLSLEQMENVSYIGEGAENGISKVKRDGHFKNSNNPFEMPKE